jgi:hypothetical protein
VTATAERICPSCRGTSPAEAQFCRQCGVILPRSRAANGNGDASRGVDRWSELGARYPVVPQLAVLAVVLVIGGMVYRHQRRSSLIPVAGVPEVASTAAPSGSGTVAEGRAAPAAQSRPSSGRAAESNARDERSRSDESPAADRESYRGGWYRVRNRAPLLEAPDENAAVVTMLKPGTKVWVTRILPGFLAVQSVTGKAPGYVSTDNVVAMNDSSG